MFCIRPMHFIITQLVGGRQICLEQLDTSNITYFHVYSLPLQLQQITPSKILGIGKDPLGNMHAQNHTHPHTQNQRRGLSGDGLGDAEVME